MFKKKQNQNPNVFEKSTELIGKTIEKGARDVVNTVNPLADIFKNPTLEERQKGNNNFNDLPFDHLNKKYAEQDSAQIEALQKQINPKGENDNPTKLQYDYHRRVMHEEEELNLEKEREEEEKKRQEALDDEQKKQAIAEEKKKQQEAIPHGKVKKSILGDGGHRKSSAELPPEFRPDAGKQ